MTLLVADKPFGIPILFGDMVISDGNGKRTSFEKKIYLISPNFAIGWAGSLIIAKTIITDIYKKFKDTPHVSRRDIEDMLKDYNNISDDNVYSVFIGWVIDNSPYCFRWRSNYPSEVFFLDDPDLPAVEGSGKDYFKEIYSEPYGFDDFNGGKFEGDEIAKAVIRYIGLTGSALIQETKYEVNLWQTFGFAYDFLYYNKENKSFIYIDKIHHILCNCQKDDDEEDWDITMNPIGYKYINGGNYSLIQKASFETGEVENRIVYPLFDSNQRENSISYKMELTDGYYVNYFSHKYKGQKLDHCIVTMGRPISFYNKLEINQGQLNNLFKYRGIDLLIKKLYEQKLNKKIEN